MKKGSKVSEAVKKRISNTLKKKFKEKELIPYFKEKKHSLESRKKIGNANRGRPCSEETRKKLSKLGQGREKSEETRKKLSNALKGRKLTKEHKRKVLEYNTLRKGKTYEQLYGKEKANELKEKARKRREGYEHSEKTKDLIRKKLEERGNPMKNEETRIKVSKANRGKIDIKRGKTFEEVYGKKRARKIKDKIRNVNLGKKHSESTLEKMRLIHLGSKSHLWRGGITKKNILLRQKSEYRIWRELVFMRDNFTCQNKDCPYCQNHVGKKLNAHHIKSFSLYPKLRLDVRNGITYCKEFHRKHRVELHSELFANKSGIIMK